MTEGAETGLDDLTSFANLSALDTGEEVSISYSHITVSKFDYMAKLLVEWTFSKTDISGTSTKCLSKCDVRLLESQIQGLKKGRDQI